MPKAKIDPEEFEFIADYYKANNGNSKTFAHDIFDKYSPCDPKYVSLSKIHAYVKGKLDRIIKDVRYKKIDVDDITENDNVHHIWCAISANRKDSKTKVPSELYEDITKIVEYKLNSLAKLTKTTKKKKKNIKKYQPPSEDEASEEEVSEDETSNEASEEEVEEDDDDLDDLENDLDDLDIELDPVPKKKTPAKKTTSKKKLGKKKTPVKVVTQVVSDNESDDEADLLDSDVDSDVDSD